MLLSLIVIVGSIMGLYQVIDLTAESTFSAVIAPLLFVLSLIAFAIWCVALMHKRGMPHKGYRHDGHFGSGYFVDDP